MGQYHIFHAVNPTFTEDKVQQRKYVGFVEAESEEMAYQKSQNFEELWNPTNPCRSTSVGDVIQGNDGFYLVKNFGFELLNDVSSNDHQFSAYEADNC